MNRIIYTFFKTLSLRKFEVKKYDVSETVPGYLPGNGV